VEEEDWSEVVQRTLQVLLALLVQEYTYCFTSTEVRILVEEEDWSEVVQCTLQVLVADNSCYISSVLILLYVWRPSACCYISSVLILLYIYRALQLHAKHACCSQTS
jgi:hypothetical protein